MSREKDEGRRAVRVLSGEPRGAVVFGVPARRTAADAGLRGTCLNRSVRCGSSDGGWLGGQGVAPGLRRADVSSPRHGRRATEGAPTPRHP